MAEKYKRPSLCNCYCSQQCPIGQRYVPFVTRRELPAIIHEMLASLNAMNSKKERLIEIAADGKISNDEIDDFIHIRQELERISPHRGDPPALDRAHAGQRPDRRGDV